MEAGYIAAVTFLITSGGGLLAQVVKLLRRRTRWKAGMLPEEDICQGLSATRELWSFTAFSLFAMSGLTRSYIDLFLIGSRVPAIILATTTIWIMSVHSRGSSKRLLRFALCMNGLFLVLSMLVIGGVSFGETITSRGIDTALACVSVLLFYGKSTQAASMVRTEKTQAVSWLREIGLVIKDGSGLWYAISIGPELFWIGLTHALSGVASTSICVAKLWVERLRR